ncbi:MAG: hypothetical protein L0Z53_25775 [Acidobacteriales bacterium]|nr:hypothetical protein [Terriglobales bacterium]
MAESANRRCAVVGCNNPYYAKGHCRYHWWRARRYDSAAYPPQRSQATGREGESRIGQVLRYYGRKVFAAGYYDSFDLLVDGFRCEVKTAEFRNKGHTHGWTFNIHRHGKLSEQTDYYILRLQSVPYSNDAIHLLLKSPIGVSTVWISMRQLLSGLYAVAVRDFDRFARGEFGRNGKKEEAA